MLSALLWQDNSLFCRTVARDQKQWSSHAASPSRLWRGHQTLAPLASAGFLAVVQCSQKQGLLCRRGYTHSRYRRIMDNIRRHMPNASISGDAIVGFPGETVRPCSAACSLLRLTAGSKCGFAGRSTADPSGNFTTRQARQCAGHVLCSDDAGAVPVCAEGQLLPCRKSSLRRPARW